MAYVNELVTGGTAFGLRALRRQQVTEAGRAANQLSAGGNLEALGDGLFGLLHGERSKTEIAGGDGKGNLAIKSSRNDFATPLADAR